MKHMSTLYNYDYSIGVGFGVALLTLAVEYTPHLLYTVPVVRTRGPYLACDPQNGSEDASHYARHPCIQAAAPDRPP